MANTNKLETYLNLSDKLLTKFRTGKPNGTVQWINEIDFLRKQIDRFGTTNAQNAERVQRTLESLTEWKIAFLVQQSTVERELLLETLQQADDFCRIPLSSAGPKSLIVRTCERLIESLETRLTGAIKNSCTDGSLRARAREMIKKLRRILLIECNQLWDASDYRTAHEGATKVIGTLKSVYNNWDKMK